RPLLALDAVSAPLELIQAVAETLEPSLGRALQPLVQRLWWRAAECGAEGRRQCALSVPSTDQHVVRLGRAQQRPLEEWRRSRADGEVGQAGGVDREAGGGNPLGKAAKGQGEPGGVRRPGPAGRPPALDAHPQGGWDDDEAAALVLAEVERPADLGAAERAPAGDRLGEALLVPALGREHDPNLPRASGARCERPDRAPR